MSAISYGLVPTSSCPDRCVPAAAASLGVLVSNLKTVWAAPTTDARLKKRIVRTLIHEVVADIDNAASEICRY
ncbi:hypothetical protein ACVIWV_009813 [Bradyrhizobium diazoefficiens]